MKNVAWIPLALLTACGDNETPNLPPDASTTDVAPDGDGFVAPTPFAVPLSAAGNDQLQSVAPGPGGTFYAAGFAAETLTSARYIVVVKLTAAGTLDSTFGTAGVAKTAVDFKGGADEIDIAVQPTGKIVVSATVANALNAVDRDVAVVRLDPDGTVDPTFGTLGVTTLDLSTALDMSGTLLALDSARGIATDAEGRIYVHAVSRGEGTAPGGGPRTDTDFTMVRLTADGLADVTFDTDGKFLLDIQQANATAKGLTVLPDGSVIGNGYATTPGFSGAQPVLYKLTTAGTLDPDFGTGGFFHDAVLTLQTEIYNVALHGTQLVTAGYGRETGARNEWVSMRFDAETGVRDLTWGGTANGVVLVDPSGLSSNCRNAVALPGGKTALIGSTGPANDPAQDAVFAVLDADGTLAPGFGAGVHVYALGMNGNDQFWGGAMSGGKLLIVGYQGGGATPTAAVNDDAYAVLLSF